MVRAAVRKDKELAGGTSYDNIFKLAREEFEQRMVDWVTKKVGCNKGLVRECLAEMKGEAQEILIENIARETLLKHSLLEFLCQSPEYSRELVR